MADSKISELSNATSLTDDDILAGVNMSGSTGTTRKFMLSRIRDYFKITFDGLYAAISHDHNHVTNGTFQIGMPDGMKKNGTFALKSDLTSDSISYDNKTSGLMAETAQGAIDELATISSDEGKSLEKLQETVSKQGKAISDHTEDTENPHGVTAKQINAVPTSEKGVKDGVATLNSSGVVPDTQLPTYVSEMTVENMTLRVTIKS